MLVQNLYNKLALIAGFPVYTNDTDTPETTRFLLDCLSEGLHSVINNIYMQNNVLERTNTIKTTAGVDIYGIDGIIKNIQLVTPAKVIKLEYMDNVNPDYEIPEEQKLKNTKQPTHYIIDKGYLRLYPIPDKSYTLKVTVSTTNLVWANNDSSRDSIEDINDSVMADTKFCKLVVLKAATLIFARAQNNLFTVYSKLYNDELRDYLERDLKTFESNRFLDRNAGHFRTDRGLLG